MRLTEREREAIREAALEFFHAPVHLFGSRLDDAASGGDIDLFIESDLCAAELEQRRIAMLGRLYRRLGERRIDLVVTAPGGCAMTVDALIKLREALQECGRHAFYLAKAQERLPQTIDGPQLETPDESLVAALDQFAYRFARLQDALGQRVLRLFLVAILREPLEDAPMRDVLDRLERLGYVNAERWEQYRAVRNALVHEYPEETDRRAVRLHLAFTMADELATLLVRLRGEAGA